MGVLRGRTSRNVNVLVLLSRSGSDAKTSREGESEREMSPGDVRHR